MKKIVVMASLATILGLTFYSASTTKVDQLLGTDNQNEQNYIVQVKGDIKGENKADADRNRNSVLGEIACLLPKEAYKITNIYDTVYNGFSITIDKSYEGVLKNLTYVDKVMREQVYAVPEDTENEGAGAGEAVSDVKAMKMANYSAETMYATDENVNAAILARGGSSTSKQGRGIKIGIIDTGMYLNQVEGTSARSDAEATAETAGFTLNPVAFQDLSSSDAVWTDDDISGAQLSHSYTRLNDKIPFAYDYAGNDVDVDPTASGSEHGTHVASLAAANGEDFKGIAPKAQIAVMKVFGDNSGGASDTAIIAALNDAAKLHLDVVNLSLGLGLYDYSDSATDATYTAVKNASDAGVIVNFAAGNDGKSTYSGTKGYSDWSTDTVETGILGNDANYDEGANIVASSNPDKAFYSSIMKVTADGSDTATAVSFSDQIKNSTTQTFDDERALSDLLYRKDEAGNYIKDDDGNPIDEEGNIISSVTEDYVVVPGVGKTTDYANIDVNGKIAVVNRGTTTFVNKVQAAQAAGAIAMICINNEPSVTFNFTMAFSDYSPKIPVVMVFQNTKSVFGSTGGTLTISKNAVEAAADGNVNSSFSSDGAAYNLDLGPTISAPGSLIMGAINATVEGETSEERGYDNLSGTSMATPNLTGAMALALGEYLPDNLGSLAAEDDTAYEAEKDLLSMKAMSTADQLVDTTGDKNIASPRMQGAGRINVESLIAADSYVTSVNNNLDGFDNVNQAKVELKNDGSLYVEDADFENAEESYISFSYTIHNDSNADRTYKPSLSVMIPQLRVQVTHDDYAQEELTSQQETVGYEKVKDTTFDASDASTYPMFVGTPTMAVNDDPLTIPEDRQLSGNITVAAGATATGTVNVRIDDLHFEKDWGDDMVTNFSGTLKEYFNTYFKEAGGSYVEGFLSLDEINAEDDSAKLTMPYMGFYGDYNVGKAVEDFDFEKDDRHTYNSDMVDNYLKNLSSTYAKASAYSGSTLSAAGSAPSAAKLNKIGSLDASALADGSSYYSVTGDTANGDNKLYAGADGVSDTLIAVFFVNRSLSDATWSIKNGTKTVKSGQIGDLYGSSGTYTSTTGIGLSKSWIVADDTGFELHRGYATIDVSKVAEGDYTLEFDFTLRSTGHVQTKSYDLVIDKTAPTLESINITQNAAGKNVLTLTAAGANATATADVTRTVTTTKVDGTEDSYQAKWTMNDKWMNNDKLHISITDYAHNTLNLLVKPSQLEFVVASTFFTNKQTWEITNYSTKGGRWSYDVSITDAAGNDVKITDDYIIYANIGTGHDDVELSIDGEDVDTPDYDADTGILTIHMSKDAATFSVNYEPKVESDDPEPTPDPGESSTTPESSTSSATSSSTPESSVTSSSAAESTSQATSSSGETKKGCFGSVVTSTTIVGALALLSTALAFKKKNEDK